MALHYFMASMDRDNFIHRLPYRFVSQGDHTLTLRPTIPSTLENTIAEEGLATLLQTLSLPEQLLLVTNSQRDVTGYVYWKEQKQPHSHTYSFYYLSDVSSGTLFSTPLFTAFHHMADKHNPHTFVLEQQKQITDVHLCRRRGLRRVGYLSSIDSASVTFRNFSLPAEGTEQFYQLLNDFGTTPFFPYRLKSHRSRRKSSSIAVDHVANPC